MNETLVERNGFSILTDFSPAEIDHQNLTLWITEDSYTVNVSWGDYTFIFLKAEGGLTLVGEGQECCGMTVVTDGKPSTIGFNSLFKGETLLWTAPEI